MIKTGENKNISSVFLFVGKLYNLIKILKRKKIIFGMLIAHK